MQHYRVIVEGRGLYQPLITTAREANRVAREAQLYYPYAKISIEQYYLPLPAIKTQK